MDVQLFSAPVTVTVVALPTLPTVTNTSQCGLAVSASAVGGGTSYNWYATPTSSTVLQAGASSTYTTAFAATTTFLCFHQTMGVCLSPRAAVTTTVNTPESVIASSSSSMICPGSSVVLASTQGSVAVYNFTWTANTSCRKWYANIHNYSNNFSVSNYSWYLCISSISK